MQNGINIESMSNIELVTLVTTILIATMGWIVAVYLQNRSLKKQFQIEIKSDIYKQFVQLRRKIQDSISLFSASSHAPLILMKSKMISFSVKEELNGQSILPYVSEDECVHDGEVLYSNWVYNELLKTYHEYKTQYISLLYLTEDWTAPLSSVLHTREILRMEIERINILIDNDVKKFEMYPYEYGHDWRKWDKDSLNYLSNSIVENCMIINCYVSDFMVIIHNELLAPYYGCNRPIRKTIDPTLKVLTKNGLISNIEDDPLVRAEAEAVIKKMGLPL